MGGCGGMQERRIQLNSTGEFKEEMVTRFSREKNFCYMNNKQKEKRGREFRKYGIEFYESGTGLPC